ncbi:cation efflux family-domain-containing protein [Irpex rosettiformis]|uniref:Cation efflux family-domain-containing protein n=1 Tax=Irpex rosettiformis TaxID=378272 RepID=A0ACB8UGG4_9APHY|nr:cation efflux family-domain-containing protein [Irpex rosettiformis]
MASLTSRRPHTTSTKGKEPERPTEVDHHKREQDHDHDHNHEHNHDDGHEHSHSHSHSHSVLSSFGHAHTHGEGGHGDADQVVAALTGKGARITLIGLASNVGLTVSKGAAGWYMNSASLLADAGHTAGDLIGDLITLFCWKLSRRSPTEKYPYGFGKFEVIGTAAVSLLLTGGALGLGLHSLSLLIHSLQHTAATLPAGALQEILVNVTQAAQHVSAAGLEHVHVHTHEHALDPNAAWFAAIGVLAKEWLFRATKKVADEERSPVLNANALHHRSDAWSSLVALVAILGTWWWPHLPLDQLGGLLVSFVIVQQGWSILITSFKQLTDAGVSSSTREKLVRALDPLLPSSEASKAIGTPSQRALLAVKDLRAMRAGALMFVDLTAKVPGTMSVADTSALVATIERTLKQERKEIAEVRIRFEPVDIVATPRKI